MSADHAVVCKCPVAVSVKLCRKKAYSRTYRICRIDNDYIKGTSLCILDVLYAIGNDDLNPRIC